MHKLISAVVQWAWYVSVHAYLHDARTVFEGMASGLYMFKIHGPCRFPRFSRQNVGSSDVAALRLGGSEFGSRGVETAESFDTGFVMQFRVRVPISYST